MKMQNQNPENIKDLKKEERKEKLIILALSLSLFLPAINNFINCFFQIGLGIDPGFLSELSYIAIVFIGVIAATFNFQKNINMFFVALIILGGIALSYFIYPKMRETIYENPVDLIYNPINKVAFFCIPLLLYTGQISDFRRAFFAMHKWARINLVLGIVTYVYVVLVMKRELQYMVFSYFMLTAICVCFENFKENRKKIDLLLMTLGTFAILLCGARGAVLSALIYILMRSVFGKINVRKKHQGIWVMSMVILGLMILFLWNNIIYAIADLCELLGVESRFITSLIDGALMESSGRSSISRAIWAGIKDNPLGFGFFGDRYAAGTYGFGRYSYAHNGFLEVIASFGVVIGPILILLFMIKLLKALKIKNTYYNMILWSLIPYGLFQLFFSSSAIENLGFYAICALMFSKKAGGKR